MSRWTTTVAFLAAALALSTEAGAFELKHSAVGELVSWHRPRIAWTVDRSVRDVPGGEAAVAAAIDAWTQRGGAPSLTIESTGASLAPGLDGKNAVFYAPDGYAPAGSALAVTVLSFDDRTGEVIDADIVINGKYRFGPMGKDATYDIGRVLAHEMGHALGLGDEPERPNALMNPYVPRSRSLVALPGDDDVLGLSTLYGAATRAREGASPDAANAGCSVALCATPAPLERSASAFAFGAVAVVAVAMGRRRATRRCASRPAQ